MSESVFVNQYRPSSNTILHNLMSKTFPLHKQKVQSPFFVLLEESFFVTVNKAQTFKEEFKVDVFIEFEFFISKVCRFQSGRIALGEYNKLNRIDEMKF